jgi:hypothetical protein
MATTTTKPKPIDIDQLTPEERAALFARLQADAAGVSQADEQKARERIGRMRALMHDRDHLRDCPVGTDEDADANGRVEAFADTRPPRPNQGIPAKPVTVIRCLECGGVTVIEEPHATVMAAIAADPDIDA